MSKDFASFMASISGESVEQRINELMEILDQVMMIIINSIDQLSERIVKLETGIQNMANIVAKFESGSVLNASSAQTTPSMAAPPPPKPTPKPMSPISARSALQNELKQLFARRKQT